MSRFGKALKLKCADNPFRGSDLMVNSMKCKLVPIFIPLDKSIFATADGFERFERRGEVAWTQPLAINFRVCIRLENKLARRIKLSCDKQFLFAWFYRN